MNISDYSSSPSVIDTSGYSYSDSSDSRSVRPIDAAYRFNPNTRNLSSQSLTESISLSNTSSIGSYSSSTGISSESLLASTDNNSSLDSFDSTASSFRDRDRDNFTGINTFSENSQF